MTTERFSLDTNVLVYAADLDAGVRRERALQILDRAVHRDCVLTLQALAEFFHVTTRRQMMARADAAAQLRDWATEFPIVTADPEALFTALEFTVGGRFSWWDALLMATAEAAWLRNLAERGYAGRLAARWPHGARPVRWRKAAGTGR
jgi:predicted nucleic acid-binding protein